MALEVRRHFSPKARISGEPPPRSRYRLMATPCALPFLHRIYYQTPQVC
jgi:hypothetical protein